MDDYEHLFVAEDVQKLAYDAAEGIIGGSMYSSDKVALWSGQITETCINQLMKQKKLYKYLINCYITPKTGAGLHTVCGYYWDNLTDGVCTSRWENKYMFCVVTIFGLAC